MNVSIRTDTRDGDHIGRFGGDHRRSTELATIRQSGALIARLAKRHSVNHCAGGDGQGGLAGLALEAGLVQHLKDMPFTSAARTQKGWPEEEKKIGGPQRTSFWMSCRSMAYTVFPQMSHFDIYRRQGEDN